MGYGRQRLEGYDTAQVCENGHPINPSSEDYPQHNTSYCRDCGAATITACPSCSEPIRGNYREGFSLAAYVPPSFCHNCGKPYPWTESRIQAAHELADELELSDADKATLNQSIDDIVRDTPRTTVAAAKFKRIAGSAGADVLQAFRSILVDILSESVKKSIWP